MRNCCFELSHDSVNSRDIDCRVRLWDVLTWHLPRPGECEKYISTYIYVTGARLEFPLSVSTLEGAGVVSRAKNKLRLSSHVERKVVAGVIQVSKSLALLALLGFVLALVQVANQRSRQLSWQVNEGLRKETLSKSNQKKIRPRRRINVMKSCSSTPRTCLQTSHFPNSFFLSLTFFIFLCFFSLFVFQSIHWLVRRCLLSFFFLGSSFSLPFRFSAAALLLKAGVSD